GRRSRSGAGGAVRPVVLVAGRPYVTAAWVPVVFYAVAIAAVGWLARGTVRRFLAALLAVNVVSTVTFACYAAVGIDYLQEYYIGYFYFSGTDHHAAGHRGDRGARPAGAAGCRAVASACRMARLSARCPIETAAVEYPAAMAASAWRTSAADRSRSFRAPWCCGSTKTSTTPTGRTVPWTRPRHCGRCQNASPTWIISRSSGMTARVASSTNIAWWHRFSAP